MPEGASPPRLLLDENLSETLLARLLDLFPGSLHVRSIGLGGASDRSIWGAARDLDCLLVTRDDDFVGLATLLGSPPKMIVIQRPNPSSTEVEALLRRHFAEIVRLLADDEASVLLLR